MWAGYPPEETLTEYLFSVLPEEDIEWLRADPRRAIAVFEWEVIASVYIITRGEYIKVFTGPVHVFTLQRDPMLAASEAESRLLELGDFVTIESVELYDVHVVNPFAEE